MSKVKISSNEQQIYILRVQDFEDDYLYLTLVLSTKKDFNKAKKLIQDFDASYYKIIDGELEPEYNDVADIYTGSYYEDLLSYLDAHNIKSIPKIEEFIYIR